MLLKVVDLFAFLSVVLRAGTLVFQSLVLGGVLFVLWTVRPSLALPADNNLRVHRSSWLLLRISAIGLCVMQALYLFVNSSTLMVTAEIGLDAVVGANFFVSGCIVLTAAVLTMIVAHENNRLAKWVLPVLAGLILGASLMTNHAVSRIEGRPLLVLLSGMHELAAGFWIGGLPFLVLALYRAGDLSAQWHITQRFSKVALVSVMLLTVSGLVMSKLYINSWAAIVGTAYGVMVSAKALMLGALLLLGGVNFLLLRNSTKEEALPRLRKLIEAEIGIGITVILTAASLTSQPPAIDLVSETVNAQQIYQRFRPTVPRLWYDYLPADSGDANGAPAKALAYNLDGEPLTRKSINDAIESESNHHWMGILVLAMGILALVARTGKAQWAAYWPLLLIGIAIFIVIQADSECWPVGHKSVGACMADPEVFQHRLAALVCVGFAIFELQVRRGPRNDTRLALVFPLMCAIGGAVLLTHSHAITSIKENLLVELSHVPLGIVAVFAGWSRWLELRLPQGKEQSILSWIWPFCFVIMGAGLLNYREM